MGISRYRSVTGSVLALLLGLIGLFATVQAQDARPLTAVSPLIATKPSAVRSIRALSMHSAVVQHRVLATIPNQIHIKTSRTIVATTHCKPMSDTAISAPGTQTGLMQPSGSSAVAKLIAASPSPRVAAIPSASLPPLIPITASRPAHGATSLPSLPTTTGKVTTGLASTSSAVPAFNPHLQGHAATNSRPMATASPIVDQSPSDQDISLPGHWYDTTPGRIGIIAGTSLLASAFDRPVHRWATPRKHDSFNHIIIQTRDILPWPAFWFAAATSFKSPWSNTKMAHTSSVAFTASILTSLEVIAAKALIGRNRPNVTNNPYSGQAFNSRYNLVYGGSSFPSGHAALSWALITPYARAYHMPWLYAFGVASAAGRVMQNSHWLSDVVGGSLLGYYTAVWTEDHFSKDGNLGLIFTGNGFMLFKRF